MATEAQVVEFLNDPSAGVLVYERDWRSSCQALMYQLCKHFGGAPVIYGSAHKAYVASNIVGTNPALAQPGDFHFFDLNTDDHVSLSFGGSRGLMGSSHCPDDAATNAGFMTVEAYCKASGAKYLGFSRTNGANDISIEVPIVAANTRIVRSDIRAKVRLDPSTTQPEVGLLPINSAHDIIGWRHGEDPLINGVPAGNNVWFQLAVAQWAWSGGFTDPSTTGILDVNPVVPPPSTAGVTKAEMDAAFTASDKKILDAIAAIPKSPTAAEIAKATLDLEAERLKS